MSFEVTDSTVRMSYLGNCDNSENSRSLFEQCTWDSARGATYQECQFVKCGFSGADLENIDLTDSTYDADTRWPAGFSPEDHGARLADGEIERLERRLAELKARKK